MANGGLAERIADLDGAVRSETHSRIAAERSVDISVHIAADGTLLRPTTTILTDYGFGIEARAAHLHELPASDTQADLLIELGDGLTRAEAGQGADAVRYADYHIRRLDLGDWFEDGNLTTQTAFAYLALEMKERLSEGREDNPVSQDFLQAFDVDFLQAAREYGVITAAKIQRSLDKDGESLPDFMSRGTVSYNAKRDIVFFAEHIGRRPLERKYKRLLAEARATGKEVRQDFYPSLNGGYRQLDLRVVDVPKPAAPVARAARQPRPEYLMESQLGVRVQRVFPGSSRDIIRNMRYVTQRPRL